MEVFPKVLHTGIGQTVAFMILYFARYWLCRLELAIDTAFAALSAAAARLLCCRMQRTTAISVVMQQMGQTMHCCCYVSYNLYAVILKNDYDKENEDVSLGE